MESRDDREGLAVRPVVSVSANGVLLSIVCLDADGCSRFRDLLFRREWPYFLVFDALFIDDRLL